MVKFPSHNKKCNSISLNLQCKDTNLRFKTVHTYQAKKLSTNHTSLLFQPVENNFHQNQTCKSDKIRPFGINDPPEKPGTGVNQVFKKTLKKVTSRGKSNNKGCTEGATVTNENKGCQYWK